MYLIRTPSFERTW